MLTEPQANGYPGLDDHNYRRNKDSVQKTSCENVGRGDVKAVRQQDADPQNAPPPSSVFGSACV